MAWRRAERDRGAAGGAERPVTPGVGRSGQAELGPRLDHIGQLVAANRLEEAEAHCHEMIAACRADPTGGPEHAATLAFRGRLAGVLLAAGRFTEAEAESRAVLEVDPDRTPPSTRLAARTTLAHSVTCLGRHDEALTLMGDLVADCTVVHGDLHAMTLTARTSWATALAYAGRYPEAEAEARRLVRKPWLVNDAGTRMVSCSAASSLAFVLNRAERHGEAERVARAALKRADGLPPRFTIILSVGLATALTGLGRHQDALDAADAAWRLHLTTPAGGRHADAGAVQLVRAEALSGLGRTEEAARQAQQALAACRSALGAGHDRTTRAAALVERLTGA